MLGFYRWLKDAKPPRVESEDLKNDAKKNSSDFLQCDDWVMVSPVETKPILNIQIPQAKANGVAHVFSSEANSDQLRAAFGEDNRVNSEGSVATSSPGESNSERSSSRPVLLAELSREARAKQLLEANALGRMVRKKTVMPSEIQKFLESNLGDFKRDISDLTSISRMIAREILNLDHSGALNTPGTKLLLGKSYAFASEAAFKAGKAMPADVRKQEAVSLELPFDMWVQKTEAGIEVELVGKKLGSGTYKTVFQSRTLNIDLNSEKHEKSIHRTVLVKANTPEANRVIIQGADIVKAALSSDMSDPSIRIAGILSKTSRVNRNKLEAREAEYVGELKTFQGSLSEKLAVIGDAARTIQRFHEKGIVHRDIKPPNILVSHDKRGYTNDYDLTNSFGQSEIRSDYPYWDALSREGIVTPFSDAYGFARTSLEMLFGFAWNVPDRVVMSDPKFVQCAPELATIRDAIRDVVAANSQTDSFLLEHSDLEDRLNDRENPKMQQEAMEELHQEFPAFGKLLAVLAAYSPDVQAPKKA
ncbi:MAG: hypothetical protein I8H75_01385 [Myxococcaceae bacterium]|nr:hypothetical protein [Myxococcaceae bacterium]MBH2005994.1 hypothetical protein [Myxococcaceae bacterium]